MKERLASDVKLRKNADGCVFLGGTLIVASLRPPAVDTCVACVMYS